MRPLPTAVTNLTFRQLASTIMSSELSLFHYNPLKKQSLLPSQLIFHSLASPAVPNPPTQLSSHLHYHNLCCQHTPTSATVFFLFFFNFHLYCTHASEDIKILSSFARAGYRPRGFHRDILTSVSIQWLRQQRQTLLLPCGRALTEHRLIFFMHESK